MPSVITATAAVAVASAVVSGNLASPGPEALAGTGAKSQVTMVTVRGVSGEDDGDSELSSASEGNNGEDENDSDYIQGRGEEGGEGDGGEGRRRTGEDENEWVYI